MFGSLAMEGSSSPKKGARDDVHGLGISINFRVFGAGKRAPCAFDDDDGQSHV